MIVVPPGRGGPQLIPRPSRATLGGRAPWAHLGPDERRVAFDLLVGRVRSHIPRFQDRGVKAHSDASAVLVALYCHNGETMVLLTRRSPAMRSHSHEVAFPGGRRDTADLDLVATALREANEEIGLDPATVTIVGELDRFVTVGSGTIVHPFVGVLDTEPANLIANRDEVEAILPVRLDELLRDEVWREEMWSRNGELPWPVTFFELVGDTVWGATAMLLRQLLSIATDC